MDATASQSAADIELPEDLAAAHALIARLLEQLGEAHRDIGHLRHRLEQLLGRLYGRSSEKIDPNQLPLFAELLGQLADQAQATTAPATPTPAPTSKPRTPHGRRILAESLPRRRFEHALSEEQRLCPCCGKPRKQIGQEITEKLGFIPAQVFVRQDVQFKYACVQCEAQAANPQITLAPKPLEPIEKSMADASLLAYVGVSKYSDHLPLHRLERILARHGIEINRSTMCDWMAGTAAALMPLYNLMKQQVLASEVIHTDDTTVAVLDKDRGKTRTGRFWPYLGDAAHPCIVFDYTPDRCATGPEIFLAGWGSDRKVFLQADAFSGYNAMFTLPATKPPNVAKAIINGPEGPEPPGDPPPALTAQAQRQRKRDQLESAAASTLDALLAAVAALTSGILETACWAHARRKFFEARSSDHARSAQALAYIRLLYDVEAQAREQYLDAQATAALRLELARPRLIQFKAWLQSQQIERGGGVLPKSPMGKAIAYALNQWDALCVYLADGRLAIDNNAAESALRPIAVGRNNWMFCGSDNGGHTAAVMFSFIATCNRHRVNAYEYLTDVLRRLPSQNISRVFELLPQNWKPIPTPQPTPESSPE